MPLKKKAVQPGASRRQKKTLKKPDKRGKSRFVLPALLLALILLAGLLGIPAANARIVRLRTADVYLSDLPTAFEGATILFLSDLDCMSEADARAAASLTHKLCQLNPDLILFGGDYSTGSWFGALNTAEGSMQDNSAFAETYFSAIADISAPLGKFAVAGEQDGGSAELQRILQTGGVQLLTDSCVTLERNGASIVLAGLNELRAGSTPYREIGDYFDGSECVIALAHNPASYIGIRVSEARGGGAWADLVLSGHTLGGQIRLFGRSFIELSEEEARTPAGWYYADDLPLLVSQGVGCRQLALRAGSTPEVWQIRLHRQSVKAAQTEIVLPDF